MTESVKQQEVPQNLLEKAQYQTVYAYSYKSRPLIKPAKLYDGVSHGIGKPFFTAVPLKLQNDYFPLSPVNFGHRLTTSALWNQPFLPIKDDKIISETHEHFSMPLGEAVALSLAPVKEKNTKTHGGPRTFQRLSGYNRGIFPIIGSAVLPATIGHLDPKSHGDANQVTITKGKDFELHQNTGTGLSFSAINERMGDLPIKIIPPVRIRKTAVAPADGDSFAAKIQIIHPSRVPAADYFKNTNSPVYPGHGFVETPKPLPSIKSFIENKVSKLNEDKSRVKPTIKPHPSAVKLFHAKHNVQVNEVANEGGFAVRGNSLPPLYSNVCGNTKDVEKNVKSPVSEVKDNFVWNGWVAEIGKTDGLKSSK